MGSQKRTKKQKKMQSLIIVLLVVVGTYAERKTSTGVDLEPIFDFLDDDDNAQVNFNELKALTSTGDADANGEVTAAELEAAWKQIAVGFGVPAEKHAKYFKLVDGVDGSDEDGVIREEESAWMSSSTESLQSLRKGAVSARRLLNCSIV